MYGLLGRQQHIDPFNTTDEHSMFIMPPCIYISSVPTLSDLMVSSHIVLSLKGCIPLWAPEGKLEIVWTGCRQAEDILRGRYPTKLSRIFLESCELFTNAPMVTTTAKTPLRIGKRRSIGPLVSDRDWWLSVVPPPEEDMGMNLVV